MKEEGGWRKEKLRGDVRRNASQAFRLKGQPAANRTALGLRDAQLLQQWMVTVFI